ncbi:MAG: hypothetical protein NTW20_07975, partial [Rhodobacterales bacterium]|nr:hypothetical protein [Rhodobacterales bacterium]
QAFYNYYVVGHLVGSEKEVRAAESGVDVIGRYAYYPLSVFQQHLGYPALAVLGAALVLFLIQAVLLRVGRTAGDAAPAEHPFGAAKLATAFTALVVLVTLAILTADTAKSPVVGSMLAVPLLLLFALLTTAMVTMRNPVATWRWQPLFALVPLAVFALGTARTLQSYSGRTSLTVARAQFEQLPRAYRAIGDYLAMFEVGKPKFFSDRFTDYQAPSSFQVSYYEMTGRAFEPADPVGRNILLTDFKPFREFLPEADVAMITENRPASDATNPMPTARMFRDNAAEIRSIVSGRMVKIDEVLINDHVVGVYVKPRTPVEGVSGGWMTSGGIKIKVLRESLPGKQFLVMKGTTIFPEQLKGSLNGSAVDVGSGEKLPLKISLAGTSYVMEVDI